MSTDDYRVPPEKLRWVCDPEQFDFNSTKDIPELEGAIGQERALKSIDFGLGMQMNGFNLFLAGEPGTGRSSTIKNLLKIRAKTDPPPPCVPWRRARPRISSGRPPRASFRSPGSCAS